MRILGLKMPLIKPGDDLSTMIARAAEQVGGLKNGDTIVISSKVIATVQGRVRELARVRPSTRAMKIAAKSGQDPEFVELVLREANRVLSISKDVILTLKDKVICANAGVDNSNAPPGHAILLPKDSNRAARELQQTIARKMNAKVGIIIADSNVKPLRMGTIGQAIGVAGLEPILDCRGQHDLYGKPLHLTFRALADQLATAAQIVMGEAAEGVPVAVLRETGVEIVEKTKHSPNISPKKCIYKDVLNLSKKI